MDFLDNYLISFLKTDRYRLKKLKGDASTRQYYRIILDKKSWVLMVWKMEKPEEYEPFLSVQKSFENSGVRVPKLYHFLMEEGFFLLEDLGDMSLEQYFWKSKKNPLKMYQRVLDQLIRIHSLDFCGGVGSNSFEISDHFVEGEFSKGGNPKKGKVEKDRSDKIKWSVYQREFSVEKLIWELEFSKKHLFKDLLKIPVSKTEEKLLNKEFHDLCKKLYRSPQVICHRDFHSRNVMILQDRSDGSGSDKSALYNRELDHPVIIDFQDALMGPVAYDLVSLFYDSYVRLDSSSIGFLVEYYKDNFPQFKKLGFRDGEEWQFFFELQILQRCFKACGSFASFKNLRNNDSYLSCLPHTLSLVLKKLSTNGNYPIWKTLLERSKPRWEVF